MTGIPLKPLKIILGQDCPYHISEEAIQCVKDFTEFIVCQIGLNAIEEFKELNHSREKQGLKPLKRLNEWAVGRACNNILKPETVNDMGLQSNSIVSLGGNTMYTHIDATKSAKEKTLGEVRR